MKILMAADLRLTLRKLVFTVPDVPAASGLCPADVSLARGEGVHCG